MPDARGTEQCDVARAVIGTVTDRDEDADALRRGGYGMRLIP